MPAVAQVALEDGYDSASLRELAGEPQASKWELASLFETALVECCLPRLTDVQARLEIARHHAESIVMDKVEPYEGVKAIVVEACQTAESVPVELTEFVGLEDEYVDFLDPTRVEFYGDPHCERVLRDLRERMRIEARRLVDNDV